MSPIVVIAGIICVILAVFVAIWLCCSKKKDPKKVEVKEAPVEVEEEIEKAPVVEETMMASPKNRPMLSATPKTKSLFELFEKQDVQEVASQASSLDEVAAVMAQAGLEKCHLIFGIDYTGSNYLQGKKTFGGKCLHDIRKEILNPYQNVITTLGETLEPFDSDGVIPAFGFGDASTKDHSVFNLKPEGIPSGFKEVLQLYNQVTPKVRLGGPTNFAPLINQAMDIVRATKRYHILVIVADGQVTNEKDTTDAIVEASNYPISIITVGVGDGPWETMKEFDEKLPVRKFDNFHFVNFAKVTKEAANPSAAFAIHALQEIPEQYKAIKSLNLLPEE